MKIIEFWKGDGEREEGVGLDGRRIEVLFLMMTFMISIEDAESGRKGARGGSGVEMEWRMGSDLETFFPCMKGADLYFKRDYLRAGW